MQMKGATYLCFLVFVIFGLIMTKADLAIAESKIICATTDGSFVMLITENELRLPSRDSTYQVINEDEYAIYGKKLGYGDMAVYSKLEENLLLISLYAKRVYLDARCG